LLSIPEIELAYVRFSSFEEEWAFATQEQKVEVVVNNISPTTPPLQKRFPPPDRRGNSRAAGFVYNFLLYTTLPTPGIFLMAQAKTKQTNKATGASTINFSS